MSDKSNAWDSFKEALRHVLCDCLCTNIDLDIQNSNGNTINISTTPMKLTGSSDNEIQEDNDKELDVATVKSTE